MRLLWRSYTYLKRLILFRRGYLFIKSKPTALWNDYFGAVVMFDGKKQIILWKKDSLNEHEIAQALVAFGMSSYDIIERFKFSISIEVISDSLIFQWSKNVKKPKNDKALTDLLYRTTATSFAKSPIS